MHLGASLSKSLAASVQFLTKGMIVGYIHVSEFKSNAQKIATLSNHIRFVRMAQGRGPIYLHGDRLTQNDGKH